MCKGWIQSFFRMVWSHMFVLIDLYNNHIYIFFLWRFLKWHFCNALVDNKRNLALCKVCVFLTPPFWKEVLVQQRSLAGQMLLWGNIVKLFWCWQHIYTPFQTTKKAEFSRLILIKTSEVDENQASKVIKKVG